MTPDEREVFIAELMANPCETLDLVVERTSLQPGRSFSAAAMDELHTQLALWIGTRVARRWQRTNEPPTRLSITVTVVAS